MVVKRNMNKKTTAAVEEQQPSIVELEKPSYRSDSMVDMMRNMMPPSMGMMDGILGGGGPGPNPIGEIMKRVLGPSETKSNKLKITGKIGDSHIDIELVDELTLRMAQQIIEKKLQDLGLGQQPTV